MNRWHIAVQFVATLSCFYATAESPPPHDKQERLIVNFAEKWNASPTLGEFMRQNIYSQMSSKDRKDLESTIRAVEWLPTRPVIAIGDKLVVIGSDNKMAGTLHFRSLEPIVVANETNTLSVTGGSHLHQQWKEWVARLPDSVRDLMKKRRTSAAFFFPDILLSPLAWAQVSAGSADQLRQIVEGTGLAFVTTADVANAARRSGRETGVGKVVTDRINAVRQKQIAAFVAATSVQGSCGAPDKYDPKFSQTGPFGGSRIQASQTVDQDGIHLLKIQIGASSKSFLIRRTFLKAADSSSQHREFSFGSDFQVCEGTNCKSVDNTQALLGEMLAEIKKQNTERDGKSLADQSSKITEIFREIAPGVEARKEATNLPEYRACRQTHVDARKEKFNIERKLLEVIETGASTRYCFWQGGCDKSEINYDRIAADLVSQQGVNNKFWKNNETLLARLKQKDGLLDQLTLQADKVDSTWKDCTRIRNEAIQKGLKSRGVADNSPNAMSGNGLQAATEKLFNLAACKSSVDGNQKCFDLTNYCLRTDCGKDEVEERSKALIAEFQRSTEEKRKQELSNFLELNDLFAMACDDAALSPVLRSELALKAGRPTDDVNTKGE